MSVLDRMFAELIIYRKKLEMRARGYVHIFVYVCRQVYMLLIFSALEFALLTEVISLLISP